MFIVDPIALHNISVLLYSDDTVTVRFLLILRLSTTSALSWVNPLLITLFNTADVSFTLYVIVSVLFGVQVNFTLVPSTAAIETGLTIKTKMKTRIQTPPRYNFYISVHSHYKNFHIKNEILIHFSN